MKKNKWSKPKLIVLVRGKPEADILAACKTGVSGAYGGGPTISFQWCLWGSIPMAASRECWFVCNNTGMS